jgi:hypothetical protein
VKVLNDLHVSHLKPSVSKDSGKEEREIEVETDDIKNVKN